MAESTYVKGLADLQRALDTLPAKLEANVMRGALRAGGNVLAEHARAHAPVAEPSDENRRLYGGRRGLLRDTIRVRVSARKGQIKATVSAGGKAKGGGDAYYAVWVETGTAPHMITAVHAKGLDLETGKATGWTVESVMHPGAQPNPYMEPALDAGSAEAVRAAAAYIRRRLAMKHGINVPEPEGANA